MPKEKLLDGVNVLAVVCTQWGDTGKGKFVDYFSEWADIIARGTGGSNAGHTVQIGEVQHIFHLVPSGILYDAKGKINTIGRGVAFDPRIISGELGILDEAGLTYENLYFSRDAHLVLPQHLVLDRAKEIIRGKGKIGTTGKGVGPLYIDHVGRIGLRIVDMLNEEIFRAKLERNLEHHRGALAHIDPVLVKEVFEQEALGSGRYYDAEKIFNTEKIVEDFMDFGQKFKDKIKDVEVMLQEAIQNGKHILLEGAQGNLLSVDYGTYPYVTSSDPSIRGLVQGTGLRDDQVDLTLGIAKGFFMTRVGAGPFPTEMGGRDSAEWCDTPGISKKDEQEKYPDAHVNSDDTLEQGIALRLAGAEYGATTGRPRRIGWLDLPLLRYSLPTTSNDLILTKLDVLDTVETIKICVAYRYEGPNYNLGDRVLKQGEEIQTAFPYPEVLEYCVPVYKEFPGWLTPTTGINDYKDLPDAFKTIISFMESETDVRVRVISVGPDRNSTIFRD